MSWHAPKAEQKGFLHTQFFRLSVCDSFDNRLSLVQDYVDVPTGCAYAYFRSGD